MENDIMTSKLTSSELKEILAGVPMSYYMKQIEDKELTGLEQYYLHLTGRKLHDTGNEI
jgi:hypothetical protein